ncbi:hypothetical protein [Bifidobacterium sp. SO1]|uniref:hypothetical protein n=1 Tax=Bifidobacterium sp. SO1 TaxID=2809029 RepID=UPI001BDC8E4A|nr:hypothetical protein [Bifidobacterium sp. SO1]MBT1161836.1 hypothetical protein [Bifidobacterium sp. SO1]
MNNPETLTIGQAESLERIVRSLRDKGFDPDGQGIRSPNLHVETSIGGRVTWWMDGDQGLANGSLNREGHGLWWLRRTYPARLHRI